MERTKRDVAMARHGMYNAMKEAGVLRSGRIQSGHVIDSQKSKAEHNKKFCRHKIKNEI